mgnify:CR=1 FL=1
MRRILKPALFGILMLLPLGAQADMRSVIEHTVQDQILPGYQALHNHAQSLQLATESHCAAADPDLRTAWGGMMDAWTRVSHLRFGPSEVDGRAFAIAFWPDPRSKTAKALNQLMADLDPAVADPETFEEVSVAARGLYALEFMLYDPAFAEQATPEYRCALIRAIATGLVDSSAVILSEWRDGYADILLNPAEDGAYRSEEEVFQELFKALSTGLQFTAETRIGRPLGTFDRPRPRRAELRRSERSRHQVIVALEELSELAAGLSVDHPEIAKRFAAGFEEAILLAADPDDPVFASVSDISGRLKVEILQQSVERLREILVMELGPAIGVGVGFNALDGD